jgi:hypothetical protein
MIKTTSKYEENGFADILRGLVRVYDPGMVVELGTQQGASAIILAQAMTHGQLWTFDSYLTEYDKPPYARTLASFAATKFNIKQAGLESRINVCYGDAYIAHLEFEEVDILHIDLCNHYDNLSVILPHWRYRVRQAIILEGGGYNKWQREHNFKPFYPLLQRHYVTDFFTPIVIKKNEDYALTILVRKDNDTNVQSKDGSDSLQPSCGCTGLRDGRRGATGSGINRGSKKISLC